jgi:hypothetical protein
MTAATGAGRPVPKSSDRLAARAVVLAIDPAVTPHDLAAILTGLAGESRAVLENALRRVTHRDPHGRSQANTRAAIGLRLALAQHHDDGARPR